MTIEIAVVIPLYNNASTVAQTLASVLAQSQPVSEIIVVDDGSTDNGAEIVATVAPTATVIKQANAGVSVARNVGIAAATCDYITFLDADDEWLPSYLSTIVALINKFPQCAAFVTGFYLRFPEGLVAAPMRHVPLNPDGELLQSFFLSAGDARGVVPLWTGAVCVRAEVLNTVGGFAAGMRLREDVDLWVRIALDYPIAFTPEALAIYAKDSPTSICDSVHPSRADNAFAQTITAAVDDGRVKPSDVVSAKKLINRFVKIHAFRAITNNDAKEGREILNDYQLADARARIEYALLTAYAWLPNRLARGIRSSVRSLRALKRQFVSKARA